MTAQRIESRRWSVVFLFLLLGMMPPTLRAHDGGPPKITLQTGAIGTYTILSDVINEGGLSFYLAHEGYDTNVVEIFPQGTFPSPGHGVFTLRALAPGKTTITFGWLYPPNDAGGLFTLELTVVAPVAAPPASAANAVSSATSNDPVNLFSGELTMLEPPDLNLGGPMPLQFARYYGSGLSREALAQGPLGDNWRSNFDWKMLRAGNLITVVSWEGRRIAFEKTGGAWLLQGTKDIPFQLAETGGQFILGEPRGNLLYTFDAAGALVEIADGKGNAHKLTYVEGRLAEVSDGLGRALKFSHSGFQQLTAVSDGERTVAFSYTNITATANVNGEFRIVDEYFALAGARNPLGAVTSYRYDGEGGTNHVRALLLEKRRPLGNVPYAQTWNTAGKVASQTEIGKNLYTFAYDGAGTVVTNPLGNTRKVLHSADGQLTSFTDEAGQSMAITSNESGQRASVQDRRGHPTRFAYHAPSGNISTITNADGTITRFDFAPRVVQGITFHDLSGITYPDGATESYTYDGGGNPLSFTDRAGKTWNMTYNNRGQVLSARNPLGGTAVFAYNSDGTLASRYDSDSPATRFEHDSLKRQVRAVRPDGAEVRTVYDAQDRVMSVTDERSNTYRYRYDANDNLLEITDPAGNLTRYAYDALDRLSQITDRLGQITSRSYDMLGNLSAITNRNGYVIRFEYDTRQRLSALVDPSGKKWPFEHDAEGILKRWANPLNEAQLQSSDLLGRAVGYTDALGRARSLARNHLGLVTNLVDELSRTNSMIFDSRGLLYSAAKPVIGQAIFERNDLGQPTRLTDPSGQQWLWEQTPMGRLRKMADPLGRETRYSYDPRGRLAATVFPDATTRATRHDARGNPLQSAFNGPNTETLDFTYDVLNRLTRANEIKLEYDAEDRITNTLSAQIAFGAAYDAGGRLTAATYSNALFTVHYEYDSRDHLTRVSDTLTGASIRFSYDDAGRLLHAERSNGAHSVYNYDAAGRVTRIREGGFIDLQYSLDAAGQVTRLNLKAPLDPASLAVPAREAFAYDAARQIANPGYLYDPRGRMIQSPRRTNTFDGASRLIRTAGAVLAYNGLDDVIRRTENGSDTQYHYNYALGTGPIVAEQNAANGPLARCYVWSPGGRLLYAIDPAARAPAFYHFDRVGSTLALTDEGGAVSDSYAYAPYGRMLGHAGNSQQPFTFIGRHGVRQEGADFYQMRARYYDAAVGSFVSPDPLPPRLEDLHSLNPYQYVSGDPLRAVDPEGRDRTVWFFGHAWIEVDVYDAQGKVTGRLALNFAPESGKSDYQVIMPRNIVYPHVVGYDIKSSQFEDELLLKEWRRLQKDPNRGPEWNPLQNCIWRTLEYAHGEAPLPLSEAKKMLAKMPVRNDVYITAAPPAPWYEEAYDYVSDSWGGFEKWLEQALE